MQSEKGNHIKVLTRRVLLLIFAFPVAMPFYLLAVWSLTIRGIQKILYKKMTKIHFIVFFRHFLLYIA